MESDQQPVQLDRAVKLAQPHPPWSCAYQFPAFASAWSAVQRDSSQKSFVSGPVEVVPRLLEQGRQSPPLQAPEAFPVRLKASRRSGQASASSLPIARIKRIMRADANVKMIAHESPLLLEKACEMFVVELTRRAWEVSEQNKRKTLYKSDVFKAVRSTSSFDFLDDILPLASSSCRCSRPLTKAPK